MTDYKQEIDDLLERFTHQFTNNKPLNRNETIQAITHLINKAEKEAYKKGFMEAHNTHMEITDKLDRIKELES